MSEEKRLIVYKITNPYGREHYMCGRCGTSQSLIFDCDGHKHNRSACWRCHAKWGEIKERSYDTPTLIDQCEELRFRGAEFGKALTEPYTAAFKRMEEAYRQWSIKRKLKE